MSDYLARPCTAFTGIRRLAGGALIDVALAIKAAEAAPAQGAILTFDDISGKVVDLDLRGTTADIIGRLTQQGEAQAVVAKPQVQPGCDEPARPRGRPKLGVVAREVTLLPRHWEWLAAQPGGASTTLRRLVDEARRADGGQTQAKAAREAAYRFLSALAGDLPGFEEVLRALFAGDSTGFAARMTAWPADVRTYALNLSSPQHPKDHP